MHTRYRPQSLEEYKKDVSDDAQEHIAKCKAMIALLQNYPDYAITVKINKLKLGMCNNDSIIKALESEIDEAQKAINKQPNKFE